MKNNSILTLCVLAIFYMTSSFAGGEMSNEDIKKVFSGKTAIGVHLKKDFDMKDYYGNDGAFVSARGNGDTLTGKWWLSKKRDAICVRFDEFKAEKKFCRAIVPDGRGGYDKVKKNGKHHIHYDKLVDGNQTS